MATNIVFWLVLGWSLLAWAHGQCEDANTQACQAMKQTDPNLCQDKSIAESLCPKFCGLCRLVCYHCDQAAVSYTECVQLRVCEPGEMCMIVKAPGQNSTEMEYIIDCATPQACNNFLVFGRRHSRDQNGARCCNQNLCNLPVDAGTHPTTDSALTSQHTFSPHNTHAYATHSTTSPSKMNENTTVQPNACILAGFIYDSHLRLCLKTYTQPLNWTEAQSACAKDGAQLVVISGTSKSRDIEQFLQDNTNYDDRTIKFWVGSTNLVRPTVFSTLTGTPTVVFDYQHYDLTHAFCVLIGASVVLDHCTAIHGYICEKNEYVRA